MKKRWVLGGAGLGLGLLMTVGMVPAQANETPAIVINSPGDGETLTSPASISGVATMSGNGRVQSVTVRVTTSTPGASGWGPVTIGGNGGNSLPYTVNPDLPYNGHYTAEVSAIGREWVDFDGDQQGGPVTRPFSLEIPPATPSGVKTAVNEEKRTVTVSWAANGEPDLLAYCVAANGKGLGCVGPATLKLVHELKDLPAGKYEYSVAAVREDANAGDSKGLVSQPAESTATVKSDPTVSLGGGAAPTTAPRSAPSGTSSSASRAPAASGGRVDLSSFGGLIGDRSELPLAPSARATEEPDTGFAEDLPFAAATPRTSIVTGEAAAQQLNGDPVSSDDGRPESLLFLAAGLLVTVILMHVLWIKAEVDRVPLDPLAPEVPQTP
jgi:hypothetical protein